MAFLLSQLFTHHFKQGTLCLMERLRCIHTGDWGEAHHIFTRKAHPYLEFVHWNIIPLSRSLHQLWHQKGTTYMCNHYSTIECWMRNKSWKYDNILLKWEHGEKAKYFQLWLKDPKRDPKDLALVPFKETGVTSGTNK